MCFVVLRLSLLGCRGSSCASLVDVSVLTCSWWVCKAACVYSRVFTPACVRVRRDRSGLRPCACSAKQSGSGRVSATKRQPRSWRRGWLATWLRPMLRPTYSFWMRRQRIGSRRVIVSVQAQKFRPGDATTLPLNDALVIRARQPCLEAPAVFLPLPPKPTKPRRSACNSLLTLCFAQLRRAVKGWLHAAVAAGDVAAAETAWNTVVQVRLFELCCLDH